jgi:hypothetical protein
MMHAHSECDPPHVNRLFGWYGLPYIYILFVYDVGKRVTRVTKTDPTELEG